MVTDTCTIAIDMRQTMVEVREAIDGQNRAVSYPFSLSHRTTLIGTQTETR